MTYKELSEACAIARSHTGIDRLPDARRLFYEVLSDYTSMDELSPAAAAEIAAWIMFETGRITGIQTERKRRHADSN